MRAITIERKYSVGDRFGYAFLSDLHMDSKEHNRELLIRELDYAKKMNCYIFLGGDIFDMILSKDMKRFSPSSEKYYGEDSHVNFAIDEAYETLKPYGSNIKAVLCGNHEVSMMKFHSIDPLAILIDKLNSEDNTDIEYLGYSAFIRIRYTYKNGKHCLSNDIFAHHGTGGSSEVTKGSITLNRFMTNNIADVFWAGHLHSKIILPDEICVYLDQNGIIKTKSRKAFITGAFVHPSKHEPSRTKGRAKPYHVSYGDTKRTYQSTGSIIMEHEFVSSKEFTTRIIS